VFLVCGASWQMSPTAGGGGLRGSILNMASVLA
jgi:hypothetical protein